MTNLKFQIIKRTNNLNQGETWNFKGTTVQYRGTAEGRRKYNVTTFEGESFEYLNQMDAEEWAESSILDYEVENMV